MPLETDLLVIFANCYKKMKQEGKTYIPDTTVAKIIILDLYEQYVKEGLKPIEDLNHEEKVMLATECRNTGEKYTNETLRQQCRILYLLKNVITNPN